MSFSIVYDFMFTGVVRYNPILAPRENLPERDTIDLVEEGFFVGIPPAVPNHRLRSTERRLRNATTMRRESVSNILGESSTDASNNADINDDGGWFEADGRLKQLADPLVPYPQRLPLTGAHAQLVGHHRALDTRIQFHGAITSDPSSVARPNLYTLDISVSSVVFTDHELYLQEHRLARQLEGLVDHDRKRSDDKPAELLTHKLAALRRAKAKAEENLRNSGRMTMGPDQVQMGGSSMKEIFRHDEYTFDFVSRMITSLTTALCKIVTHCYGVFRGVSRVC